MKAACNDNDAIPIKLGKGNLFTLPLCDGPVALSVDDKFAVLEVTTVCGKVVEIPFHTSAVRALQALAARALDDIDLGGQGGA